MFCNGLEHSRERVGSSNKSQCPLAAATIVYAKNTAPIASLQAERHVYFNKTVSVAFDVPTQHTSV